MKRKLLFSILCFLILVLSSVSAIAKTEQTITDKKYHEQIKQLWNKKKAQYTEMVKKSGENPQTLYNIQVETNNLLKYAGYCQKYAIIDELSSLYLQALDTLTTTNHYIYLYYPGSPRLSVHQLDKKYRMWVDKQKPIGQEIILESSQFLYVLSDTISIIADIKKKKRTPMMQEALKRFIPLIIEHYNRWIFSTPGPFQVRGWGCRFDGKYVPAGMNHLEFLNKKLDKKLGNGKSPAYCNAVTDVDMWIIAGVTNILKVYQKEKSLVPITPEEYKKLLIYVKTGVKLLGNRFIYTELKNFNGKPVVGAIFEPGVWDELSSYEFTGYVGKDYPMYPNLKLAGKGVGWDLSHARRYVHIFDTLIKSKDLFGFNFPKEELLKQMSNQLVYGTFNRDFKKPLFTNFMDGTNGWYRVDYSGKAGFGYGPWDLSISVLTGGYAFWSRYNSDIKKLFVALIDMLKSNDPDVRGHVISYYETNHWHQYKRTRENDFKKQDDPKTQSVLLQFLPSLCFIKECS